MPREASSRVRLEWHNPGRGQLLKAIAFPDCCHSMRTREHSRRTPRPVPRSTIPWLLRPPLLVSYLAVMLYSTVLFTP